MIIVGTLFTTMFSFGGQSSADGVFFLPVSRHFSWSRALFASLGSAGALAGGLSSPVVGWLIDRLGARRVMVGGSALALHHGYRAGYVAMALPIVVFVVPLLAICLPAIPSGQTTGAAVARDASQTPDTKLREAFGARSFWMIAVAGMSFATAGVGLRVHLIPYLTGLGYRPAIAADMLGTMFLLSAIGSFAIGRLADWLGGCATLCLVFVAAALSIALLLGAGHFTVLVVAITVFGLVRELPATLVAVAMIESLGTRRLGTLLGFQALFTTFGFAAGPIIAGRVFDLTGSYAEALILFAMMALLSFLALRATKPLTTVDVRCGFEKG